MCDYEKYQELEARLQKSEEECYRLFDELNDSRIECHELKQRLNELEMYEEWREKCLKETLRFRVFDRTWWEFFFYYVHIVLDKD